MLYPLVMVGLKHQNALPVFSPKPAIMRIFLIFLILTAAVSRNPSAPAAILWWMSAPPQANLYVSKPVLAIKIARNACNIRT